MTSSLGRPSDNLDFATALRHYIDASLYSYGQLAKLSGVPKRTIVNWVDGTTKHPRHWQSIVRVASALRLARIETDALLAAAGLPALHTLAEQNDEPEAHRLFTAWQPELSVAQTEPALLRRYLEQLGQELARLPAYFPRAAAFSFHAIYQEPRLRYVETTVPTGNDLGVPLHEGEPWSVVRKKHERMVILGLPGLGKSWLLRMEAMRVAAAALPQDASESYLLPIFVHVPELAAQVHGQYRLQTIWRTIAELAARTTPSLPEDKLVDALYNFLLQHADRVVLLLDAMDEVPGDVGLRTTARRIIVQLGVGTRARMLLSCRLLGYGAAPLGRYLGNDTAEYEILPFTNREIAHVLRVWFHDKVDKLERLQSALRRAPALAQQATNPLLLSLMCLLTEMNSAELKGDRVSLYEPILRLLLEGRWRTFEMQLPESRVRAKLRLLEVIAWCFATYRQTWWEQLPGDVLEHYIETFPEAQRLWSTWQRTWGANYEGPLWELSEWDGVLIKRRLASDGAASAVPYGFLHHTFQEFLVARFLLHAYADGGLDAPEIKTFLSSKVCEPEWHITSLLLVELLARQGWPDAQPLLARLSGQLLDNMQSLSGQLTVPAVEILLKLHGTKIGNEIVLTLRERLDRTIRDVEVNPRTRVQAARMMVECGEPWPGVVNVDAIEFVDVPAGEFWMGSDHTVDPEATPEEFPLHRRTTRAFAISCFPISNAQYRAFLLDREDGFDNPAYWQEAIALGHWQDGLVWRMRPRYTPGGAVVMEPVWTREPYLTGWPTDLPNCPIYGISWYEARAFVRWLEKRWRTCGLIDTVTQLDLPSEAEWEKAARGTDGYIYPWGNRFDGNRLNWYGHLLMAPAAIGAFPHSASPYGAEEMVGNLWEWTRSVFVPYAAGAEDSHDFGDQLRPDAEVAIRGGAYFSARARCRCAARSATLPHGRIHATIRIVKYTAA